MSVGWQQILIILVIALLLFGGGSRISNMMGEFAKGIKAFKKGLADDDKKLEDKPAAPAPTPDAKSAAKTE
ncbi:MAG: twin-arginine translocase TatA/TatE family subunit [Parvularculaceae bacterium]